MAYNRIAVDKNCDLWTWHARLPLADRKARLKALVRRKKSITYVAHLEGDGATIFDHARRLGDRLQD